MRCSRPRVAGSLGAALALMVGPLLTLGAAPALAGTEIPVARAAIPGTPPVGGAQLGSGLAVNLRPGVKALPTGLTPKAWLVADLDTGQVLGAYDAHAEHRPASTLKTLAALALIPKVDPAAKITFTAGELNLTAQKDGRTTRVGLVPGSVYPARRLFEAMLALSANDATEALAASVPGGRAATLASMNAIAATLQARDTHAATPDGLDGPGQQTSAYDLALIARAAIAQPGFTGYDTTPIVRLPSSGQPLGGSNHDRLQNSYPGVIGGKDGYTTDSGQVWWGAAAKNGHRIVVTEMDAGFEPVTQEIQLLNWGFAVDGKIAPSGTLVPPIGPAGAPEPLSQVVKSPGAAPAAAPATTAAKRSAKSGSGAWTWILGVLIALAAVALARRHLRAAGRVTTVPVAAPTMPEAVPAGRVSGTPATGTPATETPATETPTPGHPATETSTPGHPAAVDDPPATRAPAAAVLRPWEAPVREHSVVLRSSSAAGRDPGPSADLGRAQAAPVGRRVDTELDGSSDRLRSGAVKVIPAPTTPADAGDVASRNSR